MGDPIKLRKKYKKPSHPWQKARIDTEKDLIRKYGLKNKREIWKMNSILKNFHSSAKKLAASRTKQSQVESESLIRKLVSYNLLKADSQIHDVLEVSIEDILNRRLQTIIVKKGFARSMKQARQFITHGHITIDGKKIDSPSRLITEQELGKIQFRPKSGLADSEHPERVVLNDKKGKD